MTEKFDYFQYPEHASPGWGSPGLPNSPLRVYKARPSWRRQSQLCTRTCNISTMVSRSVLVLLVVVVLAAAAVALPDPKKRHLGYGGYGLYGGYGGYGLGGFGLGGYGGYGGFGHGSHYPYYGSYYG
ncbi:neuropeptide-like protein 31 [Penaeus japonicus]|uniref:neuropeptide-like protein 31 n=1 Tax=Penaeus japonicus TaxID=27405 RepID=UPI001C70C7CC|nr:neuropeptide-like protein 31 [Penaeus japonicus]